MLKEKVAFITGSSRGIGWGIAELFAKHGAHLFINGVSNEEFLQERARYLENEYGIECTPIIADVSDLDAVKAAYKVIFKKYKRLDILVNNAGIVDDGLLGMIRKESVERTFGINTLGVVYNMQCATRLLQRSQSGSIINLTSIMGVNGNVGQVVYCGSKAAVIGSTKAAAKELAPTGVRVNAIAPGFIETDMTQALSEEKYQERVDSIKMGRAGTPEDIANTALFLASDLSTYVTGQVIGVDGGMLI